MDYIQYRENEVQKSSVRMRVRQALWNFNYPGVGSPDRQAYRPYSEIGPPLEIPADAVSTELTTED